MAIEIQLSDPATGNRTLRFARSPVRLGRNPENEVPLDDRFVSEWHGVIRFDGGGVTYSDLGSRNGSFVDGQRIAADTAVPLSTASQLMFGRIALRVVTVADEQPAPLPIDVEERSGRGSTTLGWGVERPQPPPPSGRSSPAQESWPRAEAPHVPTPIPATPSSPFGGSPRPGPADLAAAATPHSIPESSRVADAYADVIARQAKLLESLCEAFVALRKGYEQFGSEVGVRVVKGTTPVHRAGSGRELLEYLMRPRAGAEGRAQDLVTVFADFGIHNVALMEAITEGVRSLVQSLDPRTQNLDPGGRLFKGAKGGKDWQRYLDRFEQLVTDDNDLHAAIFGDEFARAYARVTRSDDAGSRKGRK